MTQKSDSSKFELVAYATSWVGPNSSQRKKRCLSNDNIFK
jgi:hypothetical protein